MNSPKLAVILATDTYASIRPVVDRWRQQSARKQVELVLVAPSVDAVSPVLEHREEFENLQIVEDALTSLAVARAAGIRAATAPIVFVGETHSYPQPGFVEALLAEFSGPWSAVAPAFGNANPKGVLSWAAFLSDYGRWVEGSLAGETSETPIYNAAYRLPVLLQLGDRLAPSLDQGDELWVALRAGGHRALLAPQARLDHVNVSRPWDWVRERFLAGLLIGHHRALRWSLARRVIYLCGSFLIPFVLTWRIAPGTWRTVRRKNLPSMTIPAIVVGMTIKAAGEFAGYAGFFGDAQRQMLEYEVHKLAYAGSAQR
jgi:hypothetical protein